MTTTSPNQSSGAGFVSVEGLTKRYGDQLAVDNLSFQLTPGRVTGFIGPNGSGKTTTLKMILGLANPTSGKATFDGKEFHQLENAGKTVGVSIDSDSFHPGRTGFNHLRAFAPLVGASDEQCEKLINFVGLGSAKSKRVGGYSLGMRQRLALAHALLSDPQVLLLDEPANGLDPQGIRWLRDFLRNLAARGKTVLVSSHLLAEIELSVDDLIILSKGKAVHVGTLESVRALATQGTIVKSPMREQLLELLAANNMKYSQAPGNPAALLVTGILPDQLGEIAYRSNLSLHLLQQYAEPLEDVFLRLVGDSEGPGAL